MARITVLGTGLLGAGFARRLLDLGEEVTVWNRTASKAAPLGEAGATVADDPASAVRGADRVHLVLTADDAVDAVLDAAREGLGPETWVVDHSTNAPARVAERVPTLRAAGVRYVPAPVFMSPQNAREGTGLMLLAASDEDAEALTPHLSRLTGRVWHVGARPDLAAIHKIAGNGALVVLSGLMGDLQAIFRSQGLEADQVEALLEHFPIGRALPRLGQRVQAAPTAPASFELTMARKDVGLMLDVAGGPEALTLLPQVARAMDAAIEAGHGDRDYAIYAWRRGDEG
jgi:3-hydroxyisobutyrate dehydrogenase